MDNTILIECREQSSGGTGEDDINGMYQTVLPQAIKIEEGDQIQMKSCFVDSVAKSDNKIVIEEEDASVSMSVCYYHLNWDTENRIYNDGGAVTQTMPDGKLYFATKLETGAPTNISQCNGMDFIFKRTGGSGAPQPSHFGGMPVTFQYLDPAYPTEDKFITKTFQLPQGETAKFQEIQISSANLPSVFPFQFKNRRSTDNTANSPNLISPDAHDCEFKFNVNFPPILDNVVVAGNGSAHLHTDTFNFTLPLGTYSPDELARTITDKMARVQQDLTQGQTITGTEPVNNVFFRTHKQIRTTQGAVGGVMNNRVIRCFSADGTDYFNYDLTLVPDYYIGSSETSLLYDEGNMKFKFASIHSPYYYDKQVATNIINAGSPNKLMYVNKNSGVGFTSLQPHSLWFEKMGFDATACVKSSNITKSIGNLNNFNIPLVSATEGIDITGAYLGTDIVMNKGGAGESGSVTVPTIGGALSGDRTTPVGETSSNTTSIYAKTSQEGDGLLEEPYFLVDIGLNAPQKYMGQGFQANSIKAVVGKYYSTNSYTNGSVNDSLIPYTHRGDPFNLSTLRIRILDPDHDMAENIGDNNAVFVEIIKAPKQPKEPNALQ
tara:strand:+ start:5045 stop:6859 length:1815 start_codon:yes stop_codon:yes gene_type:complete